MRHPFALLCLLLAGSAAGACQLVNDTDPNRDRAVEALGEEDKDGPSGNHRRGTPCLLCHDEQGEANAKFAVAGTIYETPAPDAPGAANVEVEFVDARGRFPLNNPVTVTPSGNFWVPKGDWPDLTFPFKVRLARNGQPVASMLSTVNREGSCNFCHRPNRANPSALDKEIARRSFPQIYVTQ